MKRHEKRLNVISVDKKKIGVTIRKLEKKEEQREGPDESTEGRSKTIRSHGKQAKISSGRVKQKGRGRGLER